MFQINLYVDGLKTAIDYILDVNKVPSLMVVSVFVQPSGGWSTDDRNTRT